jgi:uncharacterized protein YciI
VSYWAVLRTRGPRWDHSRRLREQDEWNAHAAFMDNLAAEGFVVLGGPLGDDHVLLIVDADSEEEIDRRLAPDPWVPMELLSVESVRRWTVLLRAPGPAAPSP